MAEYIEREAKIISRPWIPQDLIDDLQMLIDEEPNSYTNGKRVTLCMARDYLKKFFFADVVEVVRCQNCIHAEPFDRNCELNTSAYMHCKLYRGDLKKYVWHKYKKYYKEYSVVDRDGFCDEGERIENV